MKGRVTGLWKIEHVTPAQFRSQLIDDIVILEEEGIIFGAKEVASAEVREMVRKDANDLYVLVVGMNLGDKSRRY